MANQALDSTTQLPASSEMKDILDIEGILHFPWGRVLFWIEIILGSLLVAYILYRLIRYLILKYLKKKSEPLTPDGSFFAEIAKLKKSKLLEKKEYRKFYFFLSDIFRQYLTARYYYSAIDKTTEEILPDLSTKIGLDTLLSKEASSFLIRADLIKFANVPTTEKEAEIDIEKLSGFVKQTTEIIITKEKGKDQ